MDDRKKGLHKLKSTSHSRWNLLVLWVSLLAAWVKLIDWYFYVNFNFLFSRRASLKQMKVRAHWVGSHIARPHRLVFIALVATLIFGIYTAHDVQALLRWCIFWGCLFSFFVSYRSLVIIYQHLERNH